MTGKVVEEGEEEGTQSTDPPSIRQKTEQIAKSQMSPTALSNQSSSNTTYHQHNFRQSLSIKAKLQKTQIEFVNSYKSNKSNLCMSFNLVGSKLSRELKTLIDRLKPVVFVYNFRDENPARIDRFLDVSATLKTERKCEFLTFWFRWDHDWEGDGIEDWEPVTYILKENEVIDIQTRVHWNIVRWLTDDPILEGKERAIIYFSKHGHAPYMQVQSNIGWLRSAFNKTKTGYATPDFLDVMDERDQYVNITKYAVIENREPPATSRAMTGVRILGRKILC